MSDMKKMTTTELVLGYRAAIIMAPGHGGSLLDGGLEAMEKEHKFRMEIIRRLGVYDRNEGAKLIGKGGLMDIMEFKVIEDALEELLISDRAIGEMHHMPLNTVFNIGHHQIKGLFEMISLQKTDRDVKKKQLLTMIKEL